MAPISNADTALATSANTSLHGHSEPPATTGPAVAQDHGYDQPTGQKVAADDRYDTDAGHALRASRRDLAIQLHTNAIVPHDSSNDLLAERDGVRPMRLPSAWYAEPPQAVELLSPERLAKLIRATAVACIVTAAGLLAWLGTAGGPSPVPAQSLVSGFVPDVPVPVPVTRVVAPPNAVSVGLVPSPAPAARGLVTTAQILAVAERFVATGDVLAARAMLSETAAAGEPRALFALAETYDPNLLASWNARDIQASPAYARVLYDAARRGGIAEAQTRLDALK